MLKVNHVIAYCCGLMLMPSLAWGQSTHQTTEGVPSPEYPLWDGVKIACDAVICQKAQVSVSTVMEELYKMHKKNEVRLPFNPTWKRGSKAPIISDNMKQLQSDFASELAKYIEKNCRSSIFPLSVYYMEPRPSQYLKKEHFVKAYVAHKMETVSDATRKAYSKKIGGIRDYRRDMKCKAEQIWNEVKGR